MIDLVSAFLNSLRGWRLLLRDRRNKVQIWTLWFGLVWSCFVYVYDDLWGAVFGVCCA